MARLMNRRRTISTLVVTALTATVFPISAAAQAPGVRGGVSVDPDQVYLGGHFETGPLVERLHFKPNLEAGFGDDITLIALNFEFVYKFPVNSPWTLYVGGGPAANIYSFDRGRDDDDTEIEPGFNVLFGAETSRGLFFEIKLGAIDSPDFKFGVGWTFR